MTAAKRDQIRRDIAVTYSIPKHYIRLFPMTFASNGVR